MEGEENGRAWSERTLGHIAKVRSWRNPGRGSNSISEAPSRTSHLAPTLKSPAQGFCFPSHSSSLLYKPALGQVLSWSSLGLSPFLSLFSSPLTASHPNYQGTVQSGPLHMPLAVLSLIFTIKSFPSTIPWCGHVLIFTQPPSLAWWEAKREAIESSEQLRFPFTAQTHKGW